MNRNKTKFLPLHAGYITGKFLLLLLSEAVYLMLFYLLHRKGGVFIGALAVIPALFGGFLFGTPGGLAAGLLSFPVNLLVIHLFFNERFQDHIFPLLFSSMLITAVGALFGYMKLLRERLRLEKEEHRKAHHFLDEIFQNLQEGVGVVDDEENVQFCNTAFADIFGISREEMPGKNLLDFLIPEERQKVAIQIKSLQSGTPVSYMFHLSLPEGDEKLIRASAVPRTNGNGEPSGSLRMFQDITELNRYETELKTSEARFRAFMDYFPGYAFINDEEWRLVYANKMHNQVFGSEPYVGESIRSFLPRDQVNNIIDANKKVLGGGLRYTNEIVPGGQRDREKRIYHVVRFPIPRDDGATVHVGGIGMDITDQIKIEDDLKKSLEEKEILLKEVYHRIKNNLAMILSLMNLQSMGMKNREIAAPYNELKEKIRAISLVHEKLYRSDDLRFVNMKNYIAELIDNFPFLETTGRIITIEYDIDENLVFDFDTVIPIGLILTELMTNAVKYAFHGMDTGSIHIELHQDRRDNHLVFSDNGCGISSSVDLEHPSSLGLSLVRALCEQLLGSTRIVSGDTGTAVTVDFPL